MKAKSYFNNFQIGEFKNECGLLGGMALKFSVSQEGIDELSCLCGCKYKFMKIKTLLILADGTLKSAVSEERIDGLS